MADLNGLLERLDPQRFVRLEFEVEDAYKKFPLDEPKVDTFPEFQKLLGRYYGHLTRAGYHCGDAEFDEEYLRDMGMDLVERVFEEREGSLGLGGWATGALAPDSSRRRGRTDPPEASSLEAG